ncbi:hypothetical protein Ddye_017416 [Dipteronia dyeriana]|uniref:DUF4371 domain-containing protein n=1 Tax=Dipteronia dyeriana TaxID=168575 RepID=A0AAD9U8P7_9ROSI|nr:hypothetical protein Ddye_017416 [Dipteronia dyeriana]
MAQKMRNLWIIDGFFKRIKTSEADSSSSKSNINIIASKNQSTKSPTKDVNQDNKSLVRNPGYVDKYGIISSMNVMKFIELILKMIGLKQREDGELVLDKAFKNACYTSPDIQKEILQVFTTRVNNEIRKVIGDVKFCIIVDEAYDESKNEQMAIVLRFVDQDGILRE